MLHWINGGKGLLEEERGEVNDTPRRSAWYVRPKAGSDLPYKDQTDLINM